jgi:hypothetical protein
MELSEELTNEIWRQATLGVTGESKSEESGQQIRNPVKEVVIANPVKEIDNTLIIENVNQYPWGILHNDAISYIKDDGIMWPSVSHAIYASIVCHGVYKSHIAILVNAQEMKSFALKCYNDCLFELQHNAVSIAYQQIFNQNDQFRRILSVIGTIQYDGDSGAIQIASEVLTDMKHQLFPGNINTEKEIITDFDLLGLRYPYNVNINGYIFKHIIQYIYFLYFQYFTKDPTKSYRMATTSENLEQDFMNVQNVFLTRNIEKSCKTALFYKFTNNVQAAKVLRAIPNFQLIDTFEFLKEYVNPVTMRYITFIKNNKLSSIPPFIQSINMNVLIQDMFFKKWVYMNRLPDVLNTINLVFKYLQRPITPDVLELFFELFYSQCNVISDTVLIYNHPIIFFEWVRTLSSKISPKLWQQLASVTNDGYRNIYLIWIYISMLLYRVTQIQRSRSYSRTIQDFQNNTPKQFTKLELYYSIRKLLYFLRRISLQTLVRFTIGENELNVVQQLFRIKPLIKIDTNYSNILLKIGNKEIVPDNSFLTQIENDLHLTFELNKTTSEIAAKQIYYLIEYLSLHMSKYPLTVRSRINFYS